MEIRVEGLSGLICDLEKRHEVAILFAWECGSRAWGLASPSSDHDVRFLFCRHPLEELAPEHPDVISEQHGVYDLQGWSVGKAVALLRGRNGALAEWLGSPVVFVRDEALLRAWRALVLHELPLSYHGYLQGLLKAERRRHLGGRRSVVLAEYLHAARPALMLAALLRDGAAFPSCSFDRLLEACDDPEAAAFLRSLAERKRSQALRPGEEGSHSAAVDRFFDRLEAQALPPPVALSAAEAADLTGLAARSVEGAFPATRVVRVAVVQATAYRDSCERSFGELCFEMLARACRPRFGIHLEGPRVWAADGAEPLPEPAQFDLLILPGSSHAAYDENAWTERLLAWVAAVVAAERVPILGICYGHQCVAQACGGRVQLSPHGLEKGCRTVRLTEEGRKVFGGRESLVLPQSHGDTVALLPPGAVLWAENEKGVQAFALKRAVCLQGHPEFLAEHTMSCLERVADEEVRREAAATVAAHGSGDARLVGEAIFRMLLLGQ